MKALKDIWADPALRIMCAALALVGAVVATIAPYQSLVAVEVFGLAERTYAIVLFCAALVSVTASLSIGVWTDQKAKRRDAAILCASIGVAGATLVAVAQAPWAFVITHVFGFPLLATLFGQIFGMVRLITAHRPAQERDAIFSAVRALFAVPFVVVLPIWALAYSNGFELRWIYAALSIGCAALLLTILRFWPRDGSGSWDDAGSGLKLRDALAEALRPFILIRVFCVGTLESGATLYMILLGLTFAATPARSTSDVALFSGIMAGLEVPVMLGMALILQRMSRINAILMGTLIYATFLAGYVWLAATPFVWAMLLLGAFGGAIMLSLPLAYLQDLMGSRAGAGGALLALQMVVAQGIAALVFAVGTALGGYTVAATIGAFTMSAGATALWWIERRQVSKNPGPA